MRYLPDFGGRVSRLTKLAKIGIVNIFLLTIFISSNIYHTIKNPVPPNVYILYIVPLIILWLMAVIFIFLQSHLCYGILYFIAGLTFAFLSDKHDVGSATLIFLCLRSFGKSKHCNEKFVNPIIFSVFSFIVFLKFAIFEMSITDVLIISFFYFGAFGLNYLFNISKGEDDNGNKRNY